MTFGTSERNVWGLPTAVEDESFAIMNRYYEAGGFFIDTGMMAPWDEQLMIYNRLGGVCLAGLIVFKQTRLLLVCYIALGLLSL